MGIFDSTSKSTQSQESLAIDDDSVLDIWSDGSVLVPTVQGKRFRDVSITYNQNGMDTSGTSGMIDAFFGRQADQADRLVETVAQVAATATGSETEAGRILKSAAVPALIAFVAYMIWRSRPRGRRKGKR